MKRFVLMSALAFLTTATMARSECVLVVDRTPCDGKMEVARKPYDGVNPTKESQEKIKTADDCMKAGEKAAKIIRKGTLSKKLVTISFDGKEIGKKQDEQACK